jgi:membrane associated rhomboid family serine protease/Tfp pilus assembly protein PilF
MRRPPPISRLPAYPVTGGVALMAVAVTLMTLTGRWGLGRFEVTPAAFRAEPWRLLTSALPHLDVFHILFNVYWLWAFGTLIEEVWGHVRTLALFALFAAGSSAAEFALFHGGLGLSGVGYGLFGLLWVLAPRDRRFAEGMDARTAQVFVAWFFLCIGLTLSGTWHVANVAHGVGALLGVLVGFAVRAREPGRRALAATAVPAVLAASYLGATVLRPRVNLAHDDSASFEAGYDAFHEGRFDDAIAQYREATRMNPKDAGAWYNLGIAYEHADHADDAFDAYRHAYELDRTRDKFRRTYGVELVTQARQAQKKGDHDKALGLLLTAAEVAPNEAAVWSSLAVSYAALGRQADADAALDKAKGLRTKLP